MAQKVDWESMGGQGDKTNGKTAFIRFKAGEDYNLRLVGHAVEFYKFYIDTGVKPTSVIVDPGKHEEASKILSEHAGKEIPPQHRYAVNVLDRLDGQIKILEGGWSIFKMFANWSKINGSHPGGKGGAEWNISAKGNGLNREYTTMPGQCTPFTAEEIDRIQVKKELYSLNDIFKSCALEDLIGKAFGEEAATTASAPAPQAAVQVAPAPQGSSGVGQAMQPPQPVASGSNLSDDPADW